MCLAAVWHGRQAAIYPSPTFTSFSEGVHACCPRKQVLLLPADDLDREPLALASDEAPRVPIESLRSARSQFSALLLDKMRAPDGSYDESFVTPGLFIPKSGQREAVDLDTNNPLSLHEEVVANHRPRLSVDHQ